MIGKVCQVFTKASSFADIKNYGSPIKGFITKAPKVLSCFLIKDKIVLIYINKRFSKKLIPLSRTHIKQIKRAMKQKISFDLGADLISILVIASLLIAFCKPVFEPHEFPNQTPPSPSTMLFQKYGNYPVSQYTGISDITYCITYTS